MNPISFDHAKSLSPELSIAAEAAQRGADVLLQYWQRLSAGDIHEKAKGDLVTAADLESEKVVSDLLHGELRDAAIVSEEGTNISGSGPVWYVDPLDGTTNFVQRFPVFAVSIGLAESGDRARDDLLCGIVYNPVTEECFYAARGRGAFRNGEPIHCSAKSDLGECMIATGFPRRYHDELPTFLREFSALFPVCRAIRRAGSAALDLCWTAQGIYDGFWEHRLSPWDIAAGALIVKEAGGTCGDFDGSKGYLASGNIIGAAPAIYPALLEHIRSARQ